MYGISPLHLILIFWAWLLEMDLIVVFCKTHIQHIVEKVQMGGVVGSS